MRSPSFSTIDRTPLDFHSIHHRIRYAMAGHRKAVRACGAVPRQAINYWGNTLPNHVPIGPYDEFAAGQLGSTAELMGHLGAYRDLRVYLASARDEERFGCGSWRISPTCAGGGRGGPE